MPTNNASKRVKFGPIDGTATFPLIFLLVYPRMMTLYVLLVFCFILFFLDRKGMKLPSLFRYLRSFMVGNVRLIRPLTRKKL